MLFAIDPVLIAATVIPALVLLIKVYRADRIEKEPPALLLSLVLYGILATGLALITETLGSYLVGLLFEPDSVLYLAVLYFGVVAVSEEGFKYLLLKRRTWRSPAFNYQFDGVVYAVFVSLGFALWENVSYTFTYGLQIALLRAVTAIPGHACFGVFMGAFYGMAKKFDKLGNGEKSKRYRRMAFWLPMLLHGSYDFIASLETADFTWAFVVFVLVLFVVTLRLVKRLSNHDHYLQGLSDQRFWRW